MKWILSFIFLFLFLPFDFGQKEYAHKILDTLCSDSFAGRGYVDNGVGKAANFLESEYKSIGIKTFKDKGYQQKYAIGVNTFPYPIEVKLNGQVLVPGQDYLIDPNSGSVQGEFDIFELNTNNYMQFKDELTTGKNIIAFNFTNLSNRDSLIALKRLAYKTMKFKPVIWVEKNKLTYSVGRTAYIYPMVILRKDHYNVNQKVYLKVNNKYVPKYSNTNIVGFIPAKRKIFKSKKFVVLTAHYDHLGKMGQAIFPGANDNASGVAMVLSLAKYFNNNPIKYNVAVCLFSGEEAGLEGSRFFVSHPFFNLNKVKFVLNIDIMGGASKGITVVNGTKHKSDFQSLVAINKANGYLNEVKIRGESANSDHHFFSQANVPAFFIYSMGQVQNYHDIYDTADNTPLNQFDEVQNLLIDFIEKI